MNSVRSFVEIQNVNFIRLFVRSFVQIPIFLHKLTNVYKFSVHSLLWSSVHELLLRV